MKEIKIKLKPKLKIGETVLYEGTKWEVTDILDDGNFEIEDGESNVELNFRDIEIVESEEDQSVDANKMGCEHDFEVHTADEGTSHYGKCKKCGVEANDIEEVPQEENNLCQCVGAIVFKKKDFKCQSCNKLNEAAYKMYHPESELEMLRKENEQLKAYIENNKHLCDELSAMNKLSQERLDQAFSFLDKKSERNPFKVGDEVKVYDYCEMPICTVISIEKEKVTVCYEDNSSKAYHYKQCEKVEE